MLPNVDGGFACAWARDFSGFQVLRFRPNIANAYICPSIVLVCHYTASCKFYVMTLQERFPAYGGRGPSDLRLGLGLGVTATILIFLRVYVRVRVNRLGTRALLWALLAWVSLILYAMNAHWS